MSPENRAAINKQNSTLSTGPVTESGKAAVSGNAVKHGLSGKSHAVLRGEEESFTTHFQGYMQTYNPQSTPERDLVRTLAENFWRLERAHRMESAAFDRAFAEALEESAEAIPALAHADAFADPQKDIQRYATYAARIQRAIEKTTVQLKALQDERKAAYAKAEEEAILLTHLANTHKKISEAAAYFNDGLGALQTTDSEAARSEAAAATTSVEASHTEPAAATTSGEAIRAEADAATTSGEAAAANPAGNGRTPNSATPNLGGFVYSFEEIKKKIVRQGRLAEARARFAPEPDLPKGALI